MPDKYYRILLKREEDAKILKWLEKDRQPGERPSRAIRRKLYELWEGEKKDKKEAYNEQESSTPKN